MKTSKDFRRIPVGKVSEQELQRPRSRRCSPTTRTFTSCRRAWCTSLPSTMLEGELSNNVWRGSHVVICRRQCSPKKKEEKGEEGHRRSVVTTVYLNECSSRKMLSTNATGECFTCTKSSVTARHCRSTGKMMRTKKPRLSQTQRPQTRLLTTTSFSFR